MAESSSKKVARAARAGKNVKVRTSQGRVFPVAVALTVILGALLIVYARNEHQANADDNPPFANVDHWHAAFGVYQCDTFLPNVPDGPGPDIEGIHTHSDGVIHIHPFATTAAGRRAKLSKFFDYVGIKSSNDSFELADGTKLEDGAKCGDQDAKLQMAVWDNRADTEPTIYDNNIAGLRFTQDEMLITVALVPEGTEIPRPASESALDNLTDVTDPDAGIEDGTTLPPESAEVTTTVAGADTTVASDTTAASTDTTTP